MKRQHVFTLACACVAAALVFAEPSSAASPRSDDAKQQVLDGGKEWIAAEVKHDEATLRRVLGENFIATFGAKPPLN